MRSLIRPFLLGVARLGLFFAVAAWLAGQSWIVFATLGVLRGSVVTTACPKGVIFGYWAQRSLYSVALIDRADWHDLDEMQKVFQAVGGETQWGGRMTTVNGRIEPVMESPAWTWRKQFVQFGAKLSDGSTGAMFHGPAIALRHVHLVATFAVLNIVLHFFYRKRSDPQPCER